MTSHVDEKETQIVEEAETDALASEEEEVRPQATIPVRPRNPRVPRKPKFLKVRGVIVVDLECENLESAAEDEKLLKELVTAFILRSRSKVVHSDSEIRERRGNAPLVLREAKFRTS